jgi:hypothetical protein
MDAALHAGRAAIQPVHEALDGVTLGREGADYTRARRLRRVQNQATRLFPRLSCFGPARLHQGGDIWMTSVVPDRDKTREIFFPFTDRKLREVGSAGGRFVYYTTADTATSILKNREIWLRSTTTMNNYMEADYGFECLRSAYGSASGKAFKAALDACCPGLSEGLEAMFNAWLPDILGDTDMTCVSEHCDDEDGHGRLSMWRAYGGRAGVALVINGAVMLTESHVLGVYASPVAYLNHDTFATELVRITENIERETAFIKRLDPDVVKNAVFNMLRFAVLCTKHPGFHEEREWRILSSPAMHPSSLVRKAVEVIRGTPQTVLKMELKNRPDEGLLGLALPDLLNRIIIGPCEFPQAILRAFRRLLKEAACRRP